VPVTRTDGTVPTPGADSASAIFGVARHKLDCASAMIQAISRACSLLLIGTADRPARHTAYSAGRNSGQLSIASATRVPVGSPCLPRSAPAMPAACRSNSPYDSVPLSHEIAGWVDSCRAELCSVQERFMGRPSRIVSRGRVPPRRRD
jgi:hypothetical protein